MARQLSGYQEEHVGKVVSRGNDLRSNEPEVGLNL